MPYHSITTQRISSGCLPGTVQIWNQPSVEGEQEGRYVEDVIHAGNKSSIETLGSLEVEFNPRNSHMKRYQRPSNCSRLFIPDGVSAL